MSIVGLEHYSKDQLIEELINRQTFAGVVIFYRGDAKAGQLEPGELVITKSPPLTREGVENLLQLGASLVPGVFGDSTSAPEQSTTEIPFRSETPPLRVDAGGAVRVGSSRISLDLVVEQYENGMTPEDMVRAYDTLTLADVYAVIGYFLRHRNEVLVYLTQRQEESKTLREQLEANLPRVTRDELMRRNVSEKADAPSGQ